MYMTTNRRDVFTNYAFIRYRFLEEYQGAISFGNGRKLDGKTLVVKKALVRRQDVSPYVRGGRGAEGLIGGMGLTEKAIGLIWLGVLQDFRGIRDGGAGSQIKDGVFKDLPLKDSDELAESNDGYFSSAEVDISVHILEGDMEWLIRSVIVVFVALTNIEEVAELIKNSYSNIVVRVCSKIMLVLTVEDELSIDGCIQMVKVICKDWIIDISPWDSFHSQRVSIVWINLQELNQMEVAKFVTVKDSFQVNQNFQIQKESDLLGAADSLLRNQEIVNVQGGKGSSINHVYESRDVLGSDVDNDDDRINLFTLCVS
ncbi:hypothetical protein COLO4_14050 [Corchorus olitorius]|uniref:Nucleotide-binding, alpha-beta plait n=1 Tax=Corchorus olitorius TaxID=93759 RepID=A0A1R3JU18_9ROSI|nr:hypothetical protein COLO4_14050 [Corchorus olitorius]